jgi:3',5'-cyclic AMP phosphodiesterase CpdA
MAFHPKATTQVRLVHLSDIHFGEPNRFAPPRTPSGDRGAPAGRLTLAESLRADIESDSPWRAKGEHRLAENERLYVAITGDLTECASADEFREAEAFLGALRNAPLLGRGLRTDEIFLAPGNHDVLFKEHEIDRRWQPYCAFYQRHRGEIIDSSRPGALNKVLLSRDERLLVAEVNSCVHVVEGSPDQARGQLDEEALAGLRDALRPFAKHRSAVRVALVHHHPVILPVFAEAGRNYDAIVNANILMGVLREHGFHVVLHGHKHYLHVFSYDAACSWLAGEPPPMLVVAGGSVASVEIPKGDRTHCNTYNLVTIKWDPNAQVARVRVETRGLRTTSSDGAELPLSRDWKWHALRTFDRVLRHASTMPHAAVGMAVPFPSGFDRCRQSMYARLRGNMPVAEVRPSLEDGQTCEARVWLEAHNSKDRRRERPVEVCWSAGPKFEEGVHRIVDDPTGAYCAIFHCWGPMLVECRMRFEDGAEARGFVYARIPRDNAHRS